MAAEHYVIEKDAGKRIVPTSVFAGTNTAPMRTNWTALQRSLPASVLERLERQVATIESVCDQLEQLAECGDEALVLQLFPDGQSARSAALHMAYLQQNRLARRA